jgi:hypothetical protein
VFSDTFTKSSTSRNGCGEMIYTEGSVFGSGRGVGITSVPMGSAEGLRLEARLWRAARYRMSKTRQSLPPLYERESSSRLERLAVSVYSPESSHCMHVCQVAYRRSKAHLYFSNASSMILRLRRLCSCTALIRAVFGSVVRNVSSRS